MKLREIKIAGYKSLANIEMSNIGNLTIVIGENSSGKTNLLESLRLLFESFKVDTDDDIFEPELTAQIWHRKNTSSRIKFDIRMELDESEIKLILGSMLYESLSKRIRKKINRLGIHRELDIRRGWIRKSLTLGDIKIDSDESKSSLNQLITDISLKLPYKLSKVQIAENGQEMDVVYILHRKGDANGYTVSPDIMEPFLESDALKLSDYQTSDLDSWLSRFNITSLKSLEDWKKYGIPSLSTIVLRMNVILSAIFKMISSTCSSSSDRLLIESDILDETRRVALSGEYNEEEEWNKLRSDFESVYRGRLTTKGEELLIEEGRRSYQVESMGSGHQSWLRLLREINQQRMIYAIEEPEAHLHPSLSRHIFNYIKEKSKSTQIILTTHSAIFIDRAEKENNWLVELSDGESHIYRFEDFTHALKVLGAKPSDRLMPESVLLVEGESDKIFFEKCASKMKFKMDDLLIIPIRGKGNTRRNLDAWVPVVQGTQIQLHVLLDHDALCLAQNLVRRGVLDESSCTIIDGELEDIYPRDLLISAMNDLFQVELEAIDPLSSPRKEYLKNKLPKQKQKNQDWKYEIAEYIAERIPKEDIPESIRTLIENMKT